MCFCSPIHLWFSRYILSQKIIWCNAAQKCSNMSVKRLKIFLLLCFYLTKVLQFPFLRRDTEKIRPKHWLNSGAVNKQHKLRHSNSGREKFGSAYRHDKKQDLLDLITALVKLNLFFSTTFPMQCTFQKNSPSTIIKYWKKTLAFLTLPCYQIKGHVESQEKYFEYF